MPVIVRSGSYAEDIEQRRRMRYAVISALNVARYAANNAQHVGYFRTSWPDDMNYDNGQYEQASGKEGKKPLPRSQSVVVPYELFQANKVTYDADAQEPNPVLALWLNSDPFQKKELKAIGTPENNARADQLRLMIEEVEKNSKGALRPISEQPLLKALVLPFAGAGSLVLLEYFTTA